MTSRLNDEYWMATALVLADECKGLTRPNPPVAAVVVKNKKMIGMGFHPAAGKPHAEIYALEDAGTKAKGATLYITLEPCSSSGRTPPCTDAIIKAGIKRVVYGCDDPNPAHAGKAASILRRKGISVTRNVLNSECRDLIAPFESLMMRGRPYVTLKLACTLDGRIADASGASKWITGKEAREAVQDMRRGADAIMVGAGTLRADDPSLTPRPAWGRKPFRVVVSNGGKLPTRSKLFTDAHQSRTIVYTYVTLKKILADLAKRGCMHVMCEGGGKLAGALLKQNLVDELKIFYAPKFLGSKARPSVVGNWKLPSAPGFEVVNVERKGQDILATLKRGK